MALGFVLGLRHALDADHVAAIAALSGAHEAGDGMATRAGLLRSVWNGVSWGIGHAATLAAAGGVALALRTAIPDRLALLFEFLVALMLIALGVASLRGALRARLHEHAHQHDGTEHTHLHFHVTAHETVGAAAVTDGDPVHRHPHAARFAVRPFLVGSLHGLAGSAALALLVLAAMPTFGLGVAYLLVFGIGSIAGMAMMSVVLGAPLVLARRRALWMSRLMRASAGTASLGLGLLMAWDLGVHRGLFR
jgi:hypothetical protein